MLKRSSRLLPFALAALLGHAALATEPAMPDSVSEDALIVPGPIAAEAAPTPQAGQIAGRVTLDGVPAPQIMVNFNLVRHPGQTGYRLPETVTDLEGRYTLPLPEDAAGLQVHAWIEARHSEHSFCPAQIFPSAGMVNADFTSCTPPRVSKRARALSGRVLLKGKGKARVAIHQAFALRKDNAYSNGQLGPAVAYTDAEGRWQFSAPSISARTLDSGYVSYLSAQAPGGLRLCPEKLFLPETLGSSAADLDFQLCPDQVEDLSSEIDPLIAAAPVSGHYTAVSLVLEGEGGITPAVAYIHAGTELGRAADLLFTRWERATQQWSAPVRVGTSLAQGAALQHLSLAGNGKMLAIAYTDHDEVLGEHVEVITSSDGGHSWQALALGGFTEQSSHPLIAVSGSGDLHLAYYYGGTENVRRIIYQKRRAGGEFRAVALPLSNLLQHETGWWSLPVLSLSLDENGVPGVVYFLGGPDTYTQLAFWKPGMSTAGKIAESHRPTPRLEADLAMTAGHAIALYALEGRTWIAGGNYGVDWQLPIALDLPGAHLQLALSADLLLAGGSEDGNFSLRRGNERHQLAPIKLAPEQTPRPRRYSLAINGEHRAVAAFIDDASGALSLFREAE